jgi:hypothetical protein
LLHILQKAKLSKSSVISKAFIKPKAAIVGSPVSVSLLKKIEKEKTKYSFELNGTGKDARDGKLNGYFKIKKDSSINDKAYGDASPLSINDCIRKIEFWTSDIIYDHSEKVIKGITHFQNKHKKILVSPVELMRATWTYAMCLMGEELGLMRKNVNFTWLTESFFYKSDSHYFYGNDVKFVVSVNYKDTPPEVVRYGRSVKRFFEVKYDCVVLAPSDEREIYRGYLCLSTPIEHLAVNRITKFDHGKKKYIFQ